MHIRRGKPTPNISRHFKTPVALTIGNFDGVHLGHQALLSHLRHVADNLGIATCVMIFEPHPREFFAPDQAPTRLTSLREKIKQLAKSNIDYVRVYRFNYDFAKITPEEFILRLLKQELCVRWLLVGDDFRFGARRTGDYTMLQAFSEKNRFEVEKMPSFLVDGQRVSSTRIRKALEAGNLKKAQHLLGRPYSICGRVIDGDKLAKKLGFPTANIQLKHNRAPLSGIFVVNVRGAVKSSPHLALPGVASLGVRPTIHEYGKLTLEVHIFDFDQSIYGNHLQIDFLHKLRDEEKYTDLDTLIQQIKTDIQEAKTFFNQIKNNKIT